jgi:hypothetical protein
LRTVQNGTNGGVGQAKGCGFGAHRFQESGKVTAAGRAAGGGGKRH